MIYLGNFLKGLWTWSIALSADYFPVFLLSLTLKAPNKIAADDILIFYFYLSKKIRLDFSYESSAKQRIYLKYQVLFSLKNNENVFIKCRLLQS